MITAAELAGLVRPRLPTGGVRVNYLDGDGLSKRERNRIACKKWRAKNREKSLQYGRDYQKKLRADPIKNAEIRERQRRWSLDNAERLKVYNRLKQRRYRARKAAK